jgi:hypothetical protein
MFSAKRENCLWTTKQLFKINDDILYIYMRITKTNVFCIVPLKTVDLED